MRRNNPRDYSRLTTEGLRYLASAATRNIAHWLPRAGKDGEHIMYNINNRAAMRHELLKRATLARKARHARR